MESPTLHVRVVATGTRGVNGEASATRVWVICARDNWRPSAASASVPSSAGDTLKTCS